MHLKDFRPDISSFESEEENLKDSESQVSASIYHEEANTLKIDKLSNRVTIISIIIPCLIGAIIAFAYLDMKERVVDVDVTKQGQVDRISQQLEEKLNALDVKIAKNKFALDNNLPEFDKKNTDLKDQITKLASSKVDAQTINAQFEKLAKQIANNDNLGKTTLQTIERINQQTLSTLEKNKTQLDAIARQIKKETDLLKKETALLKKEAAISKKKFNTQLKNLSNDDDQIGELRKNFSLMDKKYKNLERETASQAMVNKKVSQLEDDINARMNKLEGLITTLNLKLLANMSRLQNDINLLSKKPSKKVKPKPQINIGSSKSGTIKEKPLTQ